MLKVSEVVKGERAEGENQNILGLGRGELPTGWERPGRKTRLCKYPAVLSDKVSKWEVKPFCLH